MTHILTWSACKLRCSSQLRIQFFDIYWWAGQMLAQRSRLCGRVPLPAPLNTPSIPLVKKDTPTPKSYFLRFLSQNMIFGQRIPFFEIRRDPKILLKQALNWLIKLKTGNSRYCEQSKKMATKFSDSTLTFLTLLVPIQKKIQSEFFSEFQRLVCRIDHKLHNIAYSKCSKLPELWQFADSYKRERIFGV